MKSRFLIALVAVILAACGPGGPGLSRGDCAEGVCVTIRVVEPVHFNQPVTVVITVTSEKDRSDLGLTLCGGGGGGQATIDGPQGWESHARDGLVFKAGPRDCAGWFFAAKANVPVHFTRVLRFSEKDQLAEIDVALHVPPRSYVAFAHATIMYSREGVRVYGMGTPVPAPSPLPAKTWSPWIRRADGTLIPAPTPLPTPTFAPRTRPWRTPSPVTPAVRTPTRPPYP